MKKGILPIMIGSVVTLSGLYLKKRSLKGKLLLELSTMATSGLIGFGLAHILLGAIECYQNEDDYE